MGGRSEASPSRCSRNNQKHSSSFFFSSAPGGKRGHIKEKCRRRWERLLGRPSLWRCPENKEGQERRCFKPLWWISLYCSDLLNSIHPLVSQQKRRRWEVIPLLLASAADAVTPGVCLGCVSSPSSATSTPQQLSNMRVHISSWRDVRMQGLGWETWGSNGLSSSPQIKALPLTSSLVYVWILNMFLDTGLSGDFKWFFFPKLFFFSFIFFTPHVDGYSWFGFTVKSWRNGATLEKKKIFPTSKIKWKALHTLKNNEKKNTGATGRLFLN